MSDSTERLAIPSLWVAVGVALVMSGNAVSAALAADLDIQAVVRKAGNAESEKQRYRILEALSHHPDLDSALRSDLAKLLPVVDDWANGKEKPIDQSGRLAENGYLCIFFQGKAKPGSDYPPRIAKDSPLYPLWCFYRGRMLVWIPIQSGYILRDEKLRRPFHDEARELLRIAGEAFPENRILGMYNGRSIPWPTRFGPDSQAPRWANLQREVIAKLTELIHWWIDERQLADGQFGGGWGDDVEMWRFWSPLLVVFDEDKIAAGQKRISEGLFALPRMKEGYTSIMSDVEHTAEDSADTITPMMHLDPLDPVWQRRALRIVDLMREKWTGRNERGFLQYQSTFFNVHEVDLDPQRACDTVYHARTILPALLYWQRTGDEKLTELFSDWMDTWVDAAARSERGKPAGILPSAIHWPDGRVGGLGKHWWMPENYGTHLYTWPSATGMMTATLLLTYHMTGEEKYLEPIHSMARIRGAYLANPPAHEPEPGSEAWCAAQMPKFLPDTLAKYRFLTGDDQYDHLLEADANGYVRYQLTGDRDGLLTDLEKDASGFRINKESFTTEMRYTDRVLTFTERWFNYQTGAPQPSPRLGTLYCSLTGDPGSPLIFPMNAVRWRTSPRDFAALVTESSAKGLSAELYHFGSDPRSLSVEFFLLKKGQYQWSLAPVKETGEARALTVDGPGAKIAVTLEPGRLYRLVVRTM